MAFTRAKPGETRVGWIGTGVMGRSMCRDVMNGGYRATVYNRTREKAQALLDAGAAWADSPKAVAERSDVVFAIVGFPRDVREVFLGESGVLAGTRPGMILADMTTSEPTLAREIAAAASRRGAGSIDAPVSGGDVGARTRPSRSWWEASPTSSTPSAPSWSAWARRSSIRVRRAPASTPRWSIRS